LINLIDKKGSQKLIGEKMDKVHAELKDSDLKLNWFDFHGECKNMKWENLSKLVDQVQKELDSYGHFMAEISYGFDQRASLNDSRNLEVHSLQKGTFRTNCMDCLDRTNVV